MVGSDIRTGAHPCFERVVIELSGPGDMPGVRVEYVDDPVHLSPSDETVEIDGDATLVISVAAWMPSMEGDGYAGPVDFSPTNVEHILQLRQVENFEGMSAWAVGLDTERDFEVDVPGVPGADRGRHRDRVTDRCHTRPVLDSNRLASVSSLVELTDGKGRADERHRRRLASTRRASCARSTAGIEVRRRRPTIDTGPRRQGPSRFAGLHVREGLRLDHYQNGPHRLTTPLRRRADGTFEAIDWDTAIAEVAARFADVIDEHGGDTILFYGGGGQGNHLGGGYGASTRAALGIAYSSNALAQEKTGEFWVDGQLFGRSRATRPATTSTPRSPCSGARTRGSRTASRRPARILKAIANDPSRTLIVVDPRRTESADLADIHLRPRPGGDADLLAALLAVLVEEQLLADRWLAEHANGLDDVLAHARRRRHRGGLRPGRCRREPGRRARARDRTRDRWRVDLRGPRDPAWRRTRRSTAISRS